MGNLKAIDGTKLSILVRDDFKLTEEGQEEMMVECPNYLGNGLYQIDAAEFVTLKVKANGKTQN